MRKNGAAAGQPVAAFVFGGSSYAHLRMTALTGIPALAR
jgi:hypothetical protein